MKKTSSKFNVVYLYADTKEEWNCAEWRCKIPADAINQSGKATAKLISLADFVEGNVREEIESASIVIVQRNLFSHATTEMMRYRFNGTPFILDVDDAYNLMPPSVISYPFWKGKQGIRDGKSVNLSFDPIQDLQTNSKLVNAISAPSEILLNDWKEFNDTVLIRNYPRISGYVTAYNDLVPPPNLVSIGWGGSMSHLDSFTNSNVLPAIRKIVERYKTVEVLIAGGDKRIPAALKLPGAKLISWTNFETWPSILRSFTVGIAPLSGAYDKRRSWIKVLDYMLMGIPWVASRQGPYDDLEKYGTLVDNKNTSWQEAIEMNLFSPDKAKIKEAREFALAQSIDLRVDEILESYKSISEKEKKFL